MATSWSQQDPPVSRRGRSPGRALFAACYVLWGEVAVISPWLPGRGQTGQRQAWGRWGTGWGCWPWGLGPVRWEGMAGALPQPSAWGQSLHWGASLGSLHQLHGLAASGMSVTHKVPSRGH